MIPKPVVLIGLGGFGTKVLRMYKQLLIDTFGGEQEIPPIVKILAIDIQDQRTEASATEAALASSQFLHLEGINPRDFFDDSSAYPGLQQWMDPRVSDIGVLIDGAKQIRMLGRFALHMRIAEVVGKLETALFNVGTLDAHARTRRLDSYKGTRGAAVSVYVISSLCGGTGSGMLLDVLTLCNRLAEKQKLEAYVDGVFVLPEVLDRSLRSELGANTFATLAELDGWMSGKVLPWPIELPGHVVESWGGKPLRTCYLVELANNRGKTLESTDDAGLMIAQALLHQSVSPLAGSYQDAMDDIVSLVNERVQDERAMYSSLGYAALVVDPSRLVRSLSAHRVVAVIDAYLATPAQFARVAADTPLARINWLVSPTLIALQQKLSSAIDPIFFQLKAGNVKSAPPHKWAQRIASVGGNRLSSIREHMLEKLPKAVASMAAEFKHDLSVQVAHRMSRAEGGIPEARELCRVVRESLIVALRQADKTVQFQRLDERLKGVQADRYRYEGQLAMAARWWVWRRRAADLADFLIGKWNEEIQITYQQELWRAWREAVEAALQVCDAVVEDLGLIEARLVDVLTEVRRVAAEYQPGPNTCHPPGYGTTALDVVDADFFDQLYKSCGLASSLAEIQDWLNHYLARDSLGLWAVALQQSVEQLRDSALAAQEVRFAAIGGMNVVAAVTAKYVGNATAAQVEYEGVVESATPFLRHVDTPRHNWRPRHVMVCGGGGVTGGNTTPLRTVGTVSDMRREITRWEDNQLELVVQRSVHGVPFSYLTRLGEYAAAFNHRQAVVSYPLVSDSRFAPIVAERGRRAVRSHVDVETQT
ncbi:MAG: tubulin-like doman-containing protein [Candidatus Binatia bacterium]